MSWGDLLTEVQGDNEVLSGSEDGFEDSQSLMEPADDDSDIDADLAHAHGPSTSSEKRKFQNEIFKAFATDKAEETTDKEVKEAIEGSKNEILSIRDILAQQGNSAQITSPRDYQTELYQKAKNENIIAVLDTGTGKTHIATLLLRHILDVELEARANGAPPKTAFFLVSKNCRLENLYVTES